MGKSYLDPEVATLFVGADKQQGEEEVEEDFTAAYFRYQVPARVLAARLELMGHRLEDGAQQFESALASAREAAQAYGVYDTPRSRAVEGLNGERWHACLRVIVERGLSPYGMQDLPEDLRGSLVETVLEVMKDDGGLLLGTLPRSPQAALRHALAALQPDTAVVLDASSIVNSGYESWDDNHRAIALRDFAFQYASTARVLVVPEGSTDAEILSLSLPRLFPELQDFFAIMDFGFRPPGGAGNLQNVLKSFAAAGIPNRVIAVVDNDTAGRQAANSIRRLPLPKQYSCITLPPLGMADSYPCIGPSGEDRQNVNGRAASIEMYLGRDVLEGDAGILPVVRWGAFDAGLRDYQGEIESKRQVLERFREKARRGYSPDDSTWSDLRAVWTAIIDDCRRIGLGDFTAPRPRWE